MGGILLINMISSLGLVLAVYGLGRVYVHEAAGRAANNAGRQMIFE